MKNRKKREYTAGLKFASKTNQKRSLKSFAIYKKTIMFICF